MLKINVKMPRREYRHITGKRLPNQRRLKKMAKRIGVYAMVREKNKAVQLPYVSVRTKVVVSLPLSVALWWRILYLN